MIATVFSMPTEYVGDVADAPHARITGCRLILIPALTQGLAVPATASAELNQSNGNEPNV
jgi:hypothetical protein